MTITLPAGWDEQLNTDGDRFIVESLYHAVLNSMSEKTVNVHHATSGTIPTGILDEFSTLGYTITSGLIGTFTQYIINAD